MRTMAALLAAFVLFGCSTTEPLIVTGEWRAYDLLAKYEVIHRSLLRFVSDPGVSDGAKRTLAVARPA